MLTENFSEERNRAIEQLKNQEIKVIFSVDMFNEGVDIASLDIGYVFKTDGITYCVFYSSWAVACASARAKSM